MHGATDFFFQFLSIFIYFFDNSLVKVQIILHVGDIIVIIFHTHTHTHPHLFLLNMLDQFQLRLLAECFMLVGSVMFGASVNLVTRVGLSKFLEY